MPAQKPTRPAPGHSLVLPRVTDDTTQRALDRVALGARQQQATVDTVSSTVDDLGGSLGSLEAAVTALQAGARFMRVQKLTGSGTYTLLPTTTVVEFWLQAPGGGGGGAAGGANIAVGGGGGGGICLYGIAGTPGTPITPSSGAYSIPSGGTGGVIGAAGISGGDATCVIGGVTLTARGGSGGAGMASSSLAESIGGSPPAGSTFAAPVISASGARGRSGMVVSGGGFPGDGADSMFGVGGPGLHGAVGAGGAAVGYGGGGGGGQATTAGQLGGNGAPGVLVIKEYA